MSAHDNDEQPIQLTIDDELAEQEHERLDQEWLDATRIPIEQAVRDLATVAIVSERTPRRTDLLPSELGDSVTPSEVLEALEAYYQVVNAPSFRNGGRRAIVSIGQCAWDFMKFGIASRQTVSQALELKEEREAPIRETDWMERAAGDHRGAEY